MTQILSDILSITLIQFINPSLKYIPQKSTQTRSNQLRGASPINLKPSKNIESTIITPNIIDIHVCINDIHHPLVNNQKPHKKNFIFQYFSCSPNPARIPNSSAISTSINPPIKLADTSSQHHQQLLIKNNLFSFKFRAVSVQFQCSHS